MFRIFRHTTFSAFSRLLFLLICMNVSTAAYGSVANCELISSECSLQHVATDNDWILELFSAASNSDCNEESSQKIDDLQPNPSDYIIETRSGLLDHTLIISAWLDNHLPMRIEMPCLDQPLTPPEHC